MWQRSTWHECASELKQISERFRRAYWGGRTNGFGWPRHPDDESEMMETSRMGVQLLRALALAVRSEQDFGLLPPNSDIVGAFKRENACPADATELKQAGGYQNVVDRNGFIPLKLRQALNKIAHADPTMADYYIGPGNRNHDLLLYGTDRGQTWFAAISILDLVKVIHSLPDARIRE